MRLQQNPCFVLRGDPDPPVHRRQWYERPGREDGQPEVWCYTDRISYAAGDSLKLHVSASEKHFDLEIWRDGASPQQVYARDGISASWHDTPEDCSAAGCGWPVAAELTVEEDWPSGGYKLIARISNSDGAIAVAQHLFVVRPRPIDGLGRLLLVTSDATWCAYNGWGGSNHYEGITGPEGNAFSPVVSTQRPWTRGLCKLPEGAPRTLRETPARPGEMVRYPYMEWAYAYGYSKKYASAGWASYERHFARWAEAEGFDFDVIAQHDLHRDPDVLNRYACAVFVGHDEYWSAEMRDAVDTYVENGGNIARFAGNFLWQTRIEDEGRTQICYKYHADQDPLFGTDRAHLVSGAFDVAPVSRPGALTFGVNALRGVYAGLGHCVGAGPGGFTIYRPDHWAFDGARIGYGDVLGDRSRIFGYEVDGLDFRFEDGLPYPTCRDGAVPEIEILGMGLATNIEADHWVWGETLYIGSADAEFIARSRFGEVTPETRDASRRGNGMIVSWQRGQGQVFTAATCEWVAGLIRGDTQVEQVTRNVLRRFEERSHPA